MKYLLLMILFISSGFCHASEMEQYRDETAALINMGEYEEALERTIWFHNHALEYESTMYGVRISFALGEWHDFGKKYPPALSALKKIRNQKTAKLISGINSYEIFNDVVSINDELSDYKKSIDMFKAIDKQHELFAKEVWGLIKDTAIKEKELYLLKKYIANINSDYSEIEEHYRRMISMYKPNDRLFGEQYKSFQDKNFALKALQLIDIAMLLNEKESALNIKNKAYSLVKDNRLNEVLTK